MNYAAIIGAALPYLAAFGEWLLHERQKTMTPEQLAAREKEIRDALVQVAGNRDRLRLHDWSAGRL